MSFRSRCSYCRGVGSHRHDGAHRASCPEPGARSNASTLGDFLSEKLKQSERELRLRKGPTEPAVSLAALEVENARLSVACANLREQLAAARRVADQQRVLAERVASDAELRSAEQAGVAERQRTRLWYKQAEQLEEADTKAYAKGAEEQQAHAFAAREQAGIARKQASENAREAGALRRRLAALEKRKAQSDTANARVSSVSHAASDSQRKALSVLEARNAHLQDNNSVLAMRLATASDEAAVAVAARAASEAELTHLRSYNEYEMEQLRSERQELELRVAGLREDLRRVAGAESGELEESLRLTISVLTSGRLQALRSLRAAEDALAEERERHEEAERERERRHNRSLVAQRHKILTEYAGKLEGAAFEAASLKRQLMQARQGMAAANGASAAAAWMDLHPPSAVEVTEELRALAGTL